MDPTTDITTATTTGAATAAAADNAPAAYNAPAAAVPSPTGSRRDAGHPLIWAALLVWLSIEAIGDGLLALRTVLATATTSRSKTPTVTPS